MRCVMSGYKIHCSNSAETAVRVRGRVRVRVRVRVEDPVKQQRRDCSASKC